MDFEEVMKIDLKGLLAQKPELVEETEIETSRPVTYDVRKIMTYLDRYFHDNEGRYPKIGRLAEEVGLTEEVALRLIEEECQTLLDARGLPYYDVVGTTGALDPEFMAIVNHMVDPRDVRSQAAKLKVLGRNTAWWNNQLRVPANYEYYKKRVDDVFDTQLRIDAKMATARLINKDDLPAIKYFNEWTGEFSSANQQIMSYTTVIQMLMEILTRHVTGEVLAQVANEVEQQIPSLMQGAPIESRAS